MCSFTSDVLTHFVQVSGRRTFSALKIMQSVVRCQDILPIQYVVRREEHEMRELVSLTRVASLNDFERKASESRAGNKDFQTSSANIPFRDGFWRLSQEANLFSLGVLAKWASRASKIGM